MSESDHEPNVSYMMILKDRGGMVASMEQGSKRPAIQLPAESKSLLPAPTSQLSIALTSEFSGRVSGVAPVGILAPLPLIPL